MAMLALKGVSKVYAGPVTAVQDLDLEIRDQELVVLVGPSGCGKTTTLRLIAGLEDPDRGAIWIGGRQVNRVAPRDRNIAMVFQYSVLYPHMTVYQNMAVGLSWRCGGGGIRRYWRHRRHPAEAHAQADRRRTIAAQVQAVSRLLGIEHLLDRLPRQLSGGECQRVALGRAIVRQPAAFLFDEPLSHVDAQMRTDLRREIKRLHQRLRTTLVYVTHDQAEALALGERIVVMQSGRIQQSGPPREVYEQPANTFVAGFLGTPGMNLIPGRLRRFAGGAQFVSAGARAALPAAVVPAHGGDDDDDAEIILGIRPEHLWLRGRATERNRDGGRTDEGRADPHVVGSGRVVLTELTGPTVVVTVAMGPVGAGGECWAGPGTDPRRSAEWVVAVPSGQAAEVGQEVTVGWDPAWIRFFDARTGEKKKIGR